MKTKLLIEQLLKLDPTQEGECCIGNKDIWFAQTLPAYYDGALEVLKRDYNCQYYNIIGAKITDKGYKIDIRALSIEDAIREDIDLPVDLSELSDQGKLRYGKQIAIYRKESADSQAEVDTHIKKIKNDE